MQQRIVELLDQVSNEEITSKYGRSSTIILKKILALGPVSFALVEISECLNSKLPMMN